jgi:UDP-2-acetamido-2,6-beta-L-arabino-hexul-4-ose reductase
MLHIGVTGQNGFIGYHLSQRIKLQPDEYTLVEFQSDFFENEELLSQFVAQCDVIIHLAAVNRNPDPEYIYTKNINLVESLIRCLNKKEAATHVVFSSSYQEDSDNVYGKSKKEGRELFIEWAESKIGIFTGLLIPNVFGPFSKPFHNTFIATFSQAIIDNNPAISHNSNEVQLIFIDDLVKEVLNVIDSRKSSYNLKIPYTEVKKVDEIYGLLIGYRELYLQNGIIPAFNNKFELNLFNTFRSYINHETHFPREYEKHEDQRGYFIELIRANTPGQSSYSSTNIGITRGNHFHTRKVERFSVIKGEGLIQMRKIGSDKCISFHLSGDKPSYVDIPIWYTHNITNVGTEELLTTFWINEPYNPVDADTYFVNV